MPQGLSRDRYPEYEEERSITDDTFRERFHQLPGDERPAQTHDPRRARGAANAEKICSGSSRNTPPTSKAGSAISSSPCGKSPLLLPSVRLHDLNEGWASYWHSRLLREADSFPRASTWMPSRPTPTGAAACGRQPGIAVHQTLTTLASACGKHHGHLGMAKALEIRPRTMTSVHRNYLTEELVKS